MSKSKPKIVSREQWLQLALTEIAAYLWSKTGATVPSDTRVSIGFPGGGSARKRIGECWPRERSKDGVVEIFISPVHVSRNAVLDTLVHEAVHAADNCMSGHKGFFRKTAIAVGLTGKMTASGAGPELRVWLDALVARLPSCEYSALDLSGRIKQPTRMVKVQCDSCGYTLRTTWKWLMVGLPICCCGTRMSSC